MFDPKVSPKIVINPIKSSTVLIMAGVFFLLIYYIFNSRTMIVGWILIILGFILNFTTKKKSNIEKDNKK